MKIKNIILILLIICSINNVSAEFGDVEYIGEAYGQYRQCTDSIVLGNKFLVTYPTQDLSTKLYLGIINETNHTNIDWIDNISYSGSSGQPKPIELSVINNTHFILGTADTSGMPTVTCCIGNVLNNDISFGNSYIAPGMYLPDQICIKMINLTHFIYVWSTSSQSHCTIGKISGGVITYGNINNFNAGFTDLSIQIINDNLFVIFFDDNSNSDYGSYMFGNVVGNNIIFDVKKVFNSYSTTYLTSDKQNSKCILTFKNNSIITSIIGDIIGNDIIFGDKYYTNELGSINDVNFLDNTNFVIMFDQSLSIIYIKGDISGNIINYNTPLIILTTSASNIDSMDISTLNPNCFLTTYMTWSNGFNNVYGFLYNQTVIPVITPNSTHTNHSITFDDLFDDLTVWGFLTVIFRTFEVQCGGDLFWLIVIMIPFSITWIKQRSVIIPSILALLCGSVLFSLVPAASIAPIKILLTVGIAGIFYHIIKSR